MTEVQDMRVKKHMPEPQAAETEKQILERLVGDVAAAHRDYDRLCSSITRDLPSNGYLGVYYNLEYYKVGIEDSHARLELFFKRQIRKDSPPVKL